MTDPNYPFTPLGELLKEEPDTLEVRTVNRMDGGYTAHVATIKTPYDIEVVSASAKDEYEALILLRSRLSTQYNERLNLIGDRIGQTLAEHFVAMLQAENERNLKSKRKAESNPLSKCLFCGRARKGNSRGWEENPRCNECLHERAALSAEIRGPVIISEADIRGYRTITPVQSDGWATKTESSSAQRKEALMSTYMTFDELLANGDYNTVELLLHYLVTLVPFVPPSVIISALTITKKHTPARRSLYHRLFQFLAERDNEEIAAETLKGLEPESPCDKS